MEILIPAYLVGLLTAILTEIIKLFPKIGKSEILKSLVAIIIIALGAVVSIGWSWTNFYWIMLFAFANYKMIVQPVASTLGLRSQK